MMPKMVVFDLDGTLLRSDKTVSAYTEEVLRKCRAAGIKLVYATARGSSAEKILPRGLFDGKITNGGAIARAGDTLVAAQLIPWQLARPFLVACDARGLKLASQIDEVHYMNFKMPDDWADVVHCSENADFSRHEKDAEKIYTFDLSPEDISFIKEASPADFRMAMMTDGILIITHKDATKSNAVAALGKLWGILPPEIAAFGDDLIDIELLNFAGIAIAVENALPEVKAAADFTCASNDDDGVADWILKNIF